MDSVGKKVWDDKYGGDFQEVVELAVDEVLGEIESSSLEVLESKLDLSDIRMGLKEAFQEGFALPGGRILYFFCCKAAGQDKKLTPFNCFVLPFKEDSMEAIMEWNKEMSLTFKMGGGVGGNVSGLRPNGAAVNNAALASTGPVSFLDIFGKTAERVGQNKRRGALLIGMSVYHPDVMEFIQSKIDGGLTAMNISVMVDDGFMQMSEDEEVALWFPHVAEENPTFEEVKTVPYISDCYTYPEYDYFYVQSTGETRQKQVYRTISKKELWDKICECAWETGDPGVIFWDSLQKDWTGEEPLACVNPCGELPLPGYGACALAAVNLAKSKSPEKVAKLLTIFLDLLITYAINRDLYPLREQKETAKKYRQIGVGPTGVGDWFIQQNLVYGEKTEEFEALKSNIHSAQQEASLALGELYGEDRMRNSQLSTVAPTGSISMLLGCSSGIEPNFDFTYQKEINGEWVTIESEVSNGADPRTLVTAHDIPIENRIEVQAAAQRHTDGSISSTLNLSNGASIEDVKRVYELAWEKGLKGVTVFRDGSKEGALRKVEPLKKERDVLDGKTVKVPVGDQSWYVTINFDGATPAEVFINAGKSGSDTKAWTEALGRVISLYLQSNGQAGSLIEAIQDIKGSQTIFKSGWAIQSGPDAIAKALSHVLSFSSTEECPSCGARAFIYVEGCGFCKECFHEKC